MAVRDPTFWKRFSIAVHQDDAAKEENMAQRPDLKHSYVITLADLPSPATITPTSQTHITSRQPQPPSPVALSPPSPIAHASSPPTSPGDKPLKKIITAPRYSQPFSRHGNSSQLTLGLSGRPQSRFKFWTSVTADPSNRHSWLEGQRRKRRQRTWVCWAFWICLLVLVGGVVACILVLRSQHII